MAGVAGPAPAALDVIDVARSLMRIDSTSGREGEVVGLLHRLLVERGWHVTRIAVTAGREDLFAARGDGPVVTLSTHLDTVPPFLPPRLEGARLYGRGACDAKGIAAAMLCAAERLAARGAAVALLFVVGEEVTHDGAHAANAWAHASGVDSRAIIDGEPTESTLAVGTKGAMRLVVRTVGQAAHSAYPDLGRSATRELVHLLAELDHLALPADDVLGPTTINIGALAGGVADNVVAPSAEARLMARLVTPPGEFRALLERWARGRAELTVGATVPPVRLATLPGFPTSVVAYATDIPELTAWGTPYLFGPGSIRVAHTADEFVDVAELRASVAAYERLVEGAGAEAATMGKPATPG